MDPSRNGSDLTAGQKALRGLRLTRAGRTIIDAAAEAHSTTRQIEAVRAVLARQPHLEEQLENAEITLNAAQIAVGYRTKHSSPVTTGFYGKGDKWMEVSRMMVSYLSGWRTRGFKFTHIPPREAEVRVKVIDELITDLLEARADLIGRSVRATTAVPSPK